MNPFTVNYHPDYFCDRDTEITRLRENLENGLNTLVHSPRRMGKSSLIKHLFNQLGKDKSYETLFIDLFATSRLEDLLRLLAEGILKKYHSKNILEGIKTLLKGLSPSITFGHDGTPVLSMSLKESEQETTFSQLFDYLEGRKKKVVLAFDEFQEIASYPEKAEAILRTYIQKMSNVHFIFSGSTNHMMQNMFYSASRPFYQSSEVMVLEKISHAQYGRFIDSCFNQFSKQIQPEAVDYILDFTENYTYYTQVICNQCFYKTEQLLTVDEAMDIASGYIENRKIDYLNLFNLLAENQKKVVVAVANESVVSKPTSNEFLSKHKLSSASSILQAINTLHTKDIVYKTPDGFVIYDVFFKRFLQRYR